ncbi:hypothetical protein EW145_g4465 [Phellinidium pouzarii]|uniref:Ubiquitin-conjugating enzyme E2 1 n=1 Tax=Phellinidium pouzarii TaxID=167371 RepID=A0A4S4L3C8_9AGAM|nr:hypothetical protein EW145_g4465 [Phellinidium pouzarii]
MYARLRRVQKEILDCKSDKSSNITLDPVDNSLYHLKGSFKGPEGTPYEGGNYDVDIVVPESYPFQPVKMRFITKVYHPNVSSASGAICLDILKDAWSPVLTLKSTLISLQSLLCSPEPSDPQDAEVAKHYSTSRTSFEDTARYWAQIYAGAPLKGKATSLEQTRMDVARDEVAVAGLEKVHVDQFEALGFDRTKVIDVLRRLNYRGANVANINEDRVVEELLNSLPSITKVLRRSQTLKSGVAGTLWFVLLIKSLQLRERGMSTLDQRNVNNGAYLPPEILKHIFEYIEWKGSKPWALAGFDCPWFQLVRVRKALPLVCRSWWNSACCFLYSFIYLHRVGQLSSLVRTLEESTRQESRFRFGYWVEQIQIECFVPRIWEDVYRVNVLRILMLCPTIKILTNRPFLEDCKDPQSLDILRIIFNAKQSLSLSHLRELEMGEAVLTAPSTNLDILSSFRDLTRLNLSIDSFQYQLNPASIYDVTLPNLQTLICESVFGNARTGLEIIASHWTLPALRHLTLGITWTDRPSTDYYPTEKFCSSHGAQLNTLKINIDGSKKFSESLSRVLSFCPELETIAYPWDNTSPTSMTHANLRCITFLPKHICVEFTEQMLAHLEMVLRYCDLPALDTVILLDPGLAQANPLTLLSQSFTDELREEIISSDELGVRLLNSEGQPLTIFLGTDESDNNLSDSDSSFRDDNDLNDYVSSDTSDSDIIDAAGSGSGSVPCSSSYPSSEVESESVNSSGDDSMMMVDDAGGYTSQPPQLGQEDALLINERTLRLADGILRLSSDEAMEY